MKINLEHSGINLEICYNNNGVLDTVKNIDTNTYMMLEHKFKGNSYKIEETQFMIDIYKSYTCEGTYVLITDIGVFIPYRIFIPNKK